MYHVICPPFTINSKWSPEGDIFLLCPHNKTTGGQALQVRARLELDLEAGTDTQGDISLPKTREDKKRVWLSQGFKQEGNNHTLGQETQNYWGGG